MLFARALWAYLGGLPQQNARLTFLFLNLNNWVRELFRQSHCRKSSLQLAGRSAAWFELTPHRLMPPALLFYDYFFGCLDFLAIAKRTFPNQGEFVQSKVCLLGKGVACRL
jgi:hypothetical protein